MPRDQKSLSVNVVPMPFVCHRFCECPTPVNARLRTHARMSCLSMSCLSMSCICLVYLCLCLCLVYLCLCLVYLCLYLVYFERKRKIRECRVYFRDFFTGATETLINRYLNYRFLHMIWPPAFPIIYKNLPKK